MASISRKIAIDIVNGLYDSDNCTKIVIYRNQFDGGITYAALFPSDNQNKYEESPACHNVETLWTKKTGLFESLTYWPAEGN